MLTIQQLLKLRSASTEDAMKLFDSLEPVDFDFMKGRWKGYEIATGHPMDGLLDITKWYGKLFISPEEVHPLLFYTRNKNGLYSVNPLLIPLSIQFPKIKALGMVMKLLSPILQTRKPRARMRMVVYRGKLTGAMVYDHKAIIDSFVKIDDNTMLGSMDQKGQSQPYVFVLERDSTEYKMSF
jgi:hypothetical protein